MIELSTGIHMAYTSVGPEDGPVLVLLHGMTNDADSWSEMGIELHDRLPEERIIAVDLRGHGESSRVRDPADITIETMAEDVVAFLDSQGIKRASLAGHSMGSLVAQRIALDHAVRVDRLILVATTSDGRGTSLLANWLRDEVIQTQWRPALEARGWQWPQEAMSHSPLDADPQAEDWMQRYWNIYPLTPERSTRSLAERSARLPLATWVGTTDTILSFDSTEELTELSVPTLVLWGTQDAFFTRDDQQRLIASLEEATKRGGSYRWKQYGTKRLPPSGLQVDDYGHNLTWEAPVQVAADIAEFLSDAQ